MYFSLLVFIFLNLNKFDQKKKKKNTTREWRRIVSQFGTTIKRIKTRDLKLVKLAKFEFCLDFYRETFKLTGRQKVLSSFLFQAFSVLTKLLDQL